MSRETPDSSMDTACIRLIEEVMKPFTAANITFTYGELDKLLYEVLEMGYQQGAEDWFDG